MRVPATTGENGNGQVVVHHSVEELVALGVPGEFLAGDSDSDDARALSVKMVNALIAQVGLDAVTGASFTNPIKKQTKDGYKIQIKKLYDHSPTLDEMTPGERSAAIDAFVAHRSLSLAVDSIQGVRNAIDWHAKNKGWVDVMWDRTRQIKGTKPPKGKSQHLTADLYNTVLTALTERKVASTEDFNSAIDAPLLTEAWHLRQLAAITIAVSASLRTTSEIRQYLDGDVLSVDSAGKIKLVLSTSKGKSVAQVIQLDPRSDLACPVTALYNWLCFCAEHQLSRGGLLMPIIRRDRTLASCLGPGHSTSEHDALKLIRAAVPELPSNMSLHGLRATLPVAALAAGFGDDKIKAMGRWATLEVAQRYAVRTPPKALDLF